MSDLRNPTFLAGPFIELGLLPELARPSVPEC